MKESIIILGNEEIHLIEDRIILSDRDQDECREFAVAELIAKHMKEFSKILKNKLGERIRYKEKFFQKNVKLRYK